MAQKIILPAVKALAKAAMKKKAKSSMTKKAAVAAGASNETRSVRKVPSKQAMEKAILKERMPKGQSELARRARELESRMQGGPKKIGSLPSRPRVTSPQEYKAAMKDYKKAPARKKAAEKRAKSAMKSINKKPLPKRSRSGRASGR